jgi:hypothetical protein
LHQELPSDRGPGIAAFTPAIEACLGGCSTRPVLLGTVYHPTLGNDAGDATDVASALSEAAALDGPLVDLYAYELTCEHG